jgi:enediyne biosynthesis protein E4
VWLAVVSQPCDRACTIPAPGQVDKSLGEFWVENPWDIVKSGHNLSAYERKRTWMNIRGGNFIDCSFLTGTDNDGDGRCVVAGDFRNNGRQELIVRQVGGGPLLLYENNFPQRHYLKVSLRGRQSNRLGVGARLTAMVNGQQLVREMFPINSYRSQMPNLVHFGLANAERVERLEIRWPSGKSQVFKDLAADAHIVVDEAKEGADAIETVVPGRTIQP